MSSRHNPALEAVARETMSIIAAGGYTNPDGSRVDIGQSALAAITGTRTYTPQELDQLLDTPPPNPAKAAKSGAHAVIEVTLETTQEAAHRLFLDETRGDVAVLNFASAVKAGGGFLRGARAQEEDIARCSALYACLQTQTEFYAFHRMGSEIYSDRMIYSPRVPFFRVRSEELLDEAYELTVITAAAPNAGRLLTANANRGPEIEIVFRRRTGKLLALAEAKGHRTLVLGAWGCGVFANDPVMASDAFGTWLESSRFQGSFDRVVFAVYDPHPQKPSHTPFAERLSTRTA